MNLKLVLIGILFSFNLCMAQGDDIQLIEVVESLHEKEIEIFKKAKQYINSEFFDYGPRVVRYYKKQGGKEELIYGKMLFDELPQGVKEIDIRINYSTGEYIDYPRINHFKYQIVCDTYSESGALVIYDYDSILIVDTQGYRFEETKIIDNGKVLVNKD